MVIDTVSATAEGFLGVSNTEARAYALALSIEALTEQVRDRLCELAEASRRGSALIEMATEGLPDNTDNDKSEAALWAVQHSVRELDNGLCDLGGYVEALIVRASRGQEGASHG